MMFSVHRNELLNIAEFQPYPNDCLQVLETRKYAGVRASIVAEILN